MSADTNNIPAAKKILYIEHDIDLAQAVRLMLGSAGFAIDIASTYSEAMLLSSRFYDLIFINAVFPGVDIKSLIRDMKISTDNKPKILITGILPMPAIELSAMKKEGVIDYIQKPFTKTDLIRCIAKWVK
jgi:DNA-binding response OmpR family regulator